MFGVQAACWGCCQFFTCAHAGAATDTVTQPYKAAGSELQLCDLPSQLPQAALNLDIGERRTCSGRLLALHRHLLGVPCICFHGFTLEGEVAFSPAYLGAVHRHWSGNLWWPALVLGSSDK